MFIKHKKCPKCASKLKHYHWYCGYCKNQDLTNWILTLILWIVFLIIVAIVGTFVVSNFCSIGVSMPFINSFAHAC